MIRDGRFRSTSSTRPCSSGSPRSAASLSISWPNGPACRSTLMRIREATGSVAPRPTIASVTTNSPPPRCIEAQVRPGFREAAILQRCAPSARASADRRDGISHVAAEVIAPAVEAGKQPDEIPGVDLGDRDFAHRARRLRHVPPATDARVDRQHHRRFRNGARQRRAAQPPGAPTGDVFPRHLRLHGTLPGRGDAAAARLAKDLGRFVQRASVRRREGREVARRRRDAPFPNPGNGVLSALEW